MNNIKKFSEFLTESNSSREVTFTNGEESVSVTIIDEVDDNRYQVSFDELKRVLKQNKFNDDKWGQFMASYEGPDDEDPEWIYVEDYMEDEEYESFEEYDYYYLVPDKRRGTVIK